jgi:hypothetical protein
VKRRHEWLVQVLQGIRQDDRDGNFGWDAGSVEIDTSSGGRRWAVGRDSSRKAKNRHRIPGADDGLFLLFVALDFGSVRLLGRYNMAWARNLVARAFGRGNIAGESHSRESKSRTEWRLKGASETVSCCGQKRKALKKTVERPPERRPVQPIAVAEVVQPAGREISYRNTGTAALSVRGPASGNVYHFPSGGAAIAVDERDAPYFSGISQLKVEIPQANNTGYKKSWRDRRKH